MSTPTLVTARKIRLTTRTGVDVHRLFPQSGLRRVSAWCFLDHFGPTASRDAMVVAAHPHTGLQTATWLLEGAVEHRDSIGSVQRLEPGEFNLMTAGSGIAHSELGLDGTLHAVQLWLAMPDAVRNQPPRFEHHANLPTVISRGYSARVFAGTFLGATSPATVHWQVFGAQLSLESTEAVILPLNPAEELAILPLTGSIEVDGAHVESGQLYYLPAGKSQCVMQAHRDGTAALVIGGLPFDEPLVMWWNFIGRSHEEVVEMRELWNARGADDALLTHASHERFGMVFPDNVGGWIPAPELPNLTLHAR